MKKILVFVALFTATISLNAQSLNGSTFVIQSMGSNANGRVIDADGYTLGKNGTKIQLWDKNGSAHQNWIFLYANKGKDVYQIVSASPKAGIFKYLDASYDDLGKNGGKVQLYQNANSQNQLWRVTKNANGTYRIQSIHPKAKGACLDADGSTQGKNGGKVQMWQYLNNPNQAWKLIADTIAFSILDKVWKNTSGNVNQEFKSNGVHLLNGKSSKWSWYDEGKLIMKITDSSNNIFYYKFSKVTEKTMGMEMTTSSPKKNQWYGLKGYTTN